ncbi:MAG: Hsp33 family molecular chaperone HslO [Acidobacteriota bacterium]|nr:Hsp33 family molecular chaperone HslO [Acidobacteriota bacterium]
MHLGTAGDGGLRWAVANMAPVVEQARLQRDLSPAAAIGLGQMLTAAALLSRFISKQPLRIVLDARGDGPLGRIRAEADSLGRVRGLVEHRRATAPGQEGQGSPDLGTGTLRVMRQLHHKNYDSRVALVGGGVARNIAHFLDQSEQIRSAVVLGVLAKPDGVAAGGGLIVEALPGADGTLIRKLEGRFAEFPSVSRVLEGEGPWGLLARALGDVERQQLEERHLLLACDCDRDRFQQHLRTLILHEHDLLEEGEDSLSVQCSFCGEDYVFGADELLTLM